MISGEYALLKLIPLKLWYRHVLTIRKPNSASSSSHATDTGHHTSGCESQAHTTAAASAAAAGIGSPTKYLRSGRPGFLGTGFTCTLNRARRHAPHSRNRKAIKYPALKICPRIDRTR